MTLVVNEKRLRECFWMLGLVLPISKEKCQTLSDVLGTDVSKLMPDLLLTIANLCLTDKEALEGFIDFFEESFDYIQEFTNTPPTVDLDSEEYQKFLTQVKVNQIIDKKKNESN